MKGSIVYEETASLPAAARGFRPENASDRAVIRLHVRRPEVPAMQWIAERFFTNGHEWIDAASGNAVSLHVFRSDDDEVEWSEECSRLANLRHPLLNPLIDHGIGPNRCRFEAYERLPALVIGPGRNEGTIDRHLQEFLQSRNVGLTVSRRVMALRRQASGPAAAGRPVGIMLQPRRALDAVEEALDRLSPPGPSIVNVIGVPNAGLRTFRPIVARAARLRGFVPVAPRTVRRWPALIETLRDRHVCLLDDIHELNRSAMVVSRTISALASGSARRHVIVRFRRDAVTAGVALEPLSVGAMVRMVFALTDLDPREDELIDAARAADGLPGVFIERLSGLYRHSSGAMVIHETAPQYVVEPIPEPEPATIGGRVLGAALRASDRARRLAAIGRHAMAARLLERAIRVLRGRDRALEGARCALQLGWLALDRGKTAAARQAFDTARQLAGDHPSALDATIGSGVAFTDDGRLIEAEAMLRGVVAAATTIGRAACAQAATAALARCLYWQERYEEALALTSLDAGVPRDPVSSARLLAVASRAQAGLARTSTAVRTAREAQRLAAGGEGRVQITAELALAESLGAAGDIEGARAALSRATRLSRALHLPLARVRAMLVASAHGDRRRSTRTLARLRALRLPPLLAERLQRAICAPPDSRIEPVVEVEALLMLSQRATDDAAAAAEICKTVASRIGAVTVAIFSHDDRALAVHGRGWRSVPAIVRQAAAQREPIRPDGPLEPREAAEPLRYGGDVIAVIAARWVAGATIDVEGACVLLRAAALAAAPNVRALLDRSVAPPLGRWGDLLGRSEPAAALREAAARAARAPFAVLIEGESGSGKELVARAIHRLSPRRERRFCALNCAALTDDLVEAELFGHTRGAFTGAATDRMGLFEEANGGTLFLDEIGELSGRAQAKLLRVLQEGEVRRVGENFPRRVDVRVVAATNRTLEEEVRAGRFRADLRFRLDVVKIHVPPLRDRASDVPLLAAHFWQDAADRVGSRATLTPEALAALARYDWPGNVRELQNVIAWIAVQSPRQGRIGPSALPRHVAQASVPAIGTFEAARADFERRFVRAALASAHGQRTRAAETLGVTRQGLAKMIRRLGIEG
jgi:DNA-binding NtrC family response regulator/tetratricopeptide (TPR) repeat protein